MKKYVKPDVYFESFELSHNVASCYVQDDDTKANGHYSDGNSCTYTYMDMIIFNSANSACIPAEIYCEQTGSDSLNFFAS